MALFIACTYFSLSRALCIFFFEDGVLVSLSCHSLLPHFFFHSAVPTNCGQNTSVFAIIPCQTRKAYTCVHKQKECKSASRCEQKRTFVLSRQLQHPAPLFAWSPLENYEFSINKHTNVHWKAFASFSRSASAASALALVHHTNAIVCFMTMVVRSVLFFAYQKWFNILLLMFVLLSMMDADGWSDIA